MDGPPAESAAELDNENTYQIGELTHAVQDLQRRVEALEHRLEAAAPEPEPSGAWSAPPLETGIGEFSSGLLASLGRVLLGIAGAYLLRAVTEANVLPHLAGTIAGVLYACAWLIPFQRPGANNRLVAPLHALTASAILPPLLWEATLRFHTLKPSGAAAVLALFLVLGEIIAWRCDSSWLAGIVTLTSSATAIALIVATLDPMPFAIALMIAALVVEYGACRDRVLPTRWMIALAADFCAALLAYLITRPQGLPDGYATVPVPAVIVVVWSLLTIYLASILLRTLVLKNRIRWFEIVQLVAVAGLAIRTSLQVAQGRETVVLAVGLGCLMAAAGAYAAAGFKLVRRLERNTYAYATFALLLTLAGCWLLVRGLALAALWSILALAATALGDHWRANALRVHGAFYLAAAALASGLINWAPPIAATALIGASSGLVYTLMVWERAGQAPPWFERVPSAVAAGLLCWSLIGVATGSAIALRLPVPLSSTLRTAVISGAAIVLAWLGSRWRLKELIWLLYPWMFFGAIKLILDDFGHGQSATLFISLVVYGAALIALPRLLRYKSDDRRLQHQ